MHSSITSASTSASKPGKPIHIMNDVRPHVISTSTDVAEVSSSKPKNTKTRDTIRLPGNMTELRTISQPLTEPQLSMPPPLLLILQQQQHQKHSLPPPLQPNRPPLLSHAKAGTALAASITGQEPGCQDQQLQQQQQQQQQKQQTVPISPGLTRAESIRCVSPAEIHVPNELSRPITCQAGIAGPQTLEEDESMVALQNLIKSHVTQICSKQISELETAHRSEMLRLKCDMGRDITNLETNLRNVESENSQLKKLLEENKKYCVEIQDTASHLVAKIADIHQHFRYVLSPY
jgi:hypothetical protein